MSQAAAIFRPASRVYYKRWRPFLPKQLCASLRKVMRSQRQLLSPRSAGDGCEGSTRTHRLDSYEMLEPNRAPLPRHRLMPPNLSLCRRFPSRSRVAHSMSRNRGISRRSRRMSCFPDGSLTTTRQRMLSQGPPIGRSDRGLTSDRVVMQRQILCRLHRPRCQRRSHKRHASPVCTLCLKSGYDEDCGKSLIPPLPTWVIKYKQHLSRSPQLQAPPRLLHWPPPKLLPATHL